MENILVSAGVVFPLFFMLALGYLIQRAHLVSQEIFDGCSDLVFKAFLPIHMFRNIVAAPPGEAFDLPLLAMSVLGVVGFFLLSFLIVPRITDSNPLRGTMIQGAFRGNFVLFGMTIAQNMYGPSAAGAVAMVVAVLVPVYNILSVVALEWFRGGRPNLKKILIGIAKNPLVLAAAAGLLYVAVGLPMPALLNQCLAEVGNVSTPLAIVALGGTFQFSALKHNRGPLLQVVFAKLILMPALVLGAGAAIGLRGLQLIVLLGTCATPTAVSSFPMAQSMGGDGELAGQVVVFTTLLSVFTIFLWILAFKTFGLV